MRNVPKPPKSHKAPKSPKSPSRDHLTKTSAKGKVELSEQELSRVSGGTALKIKID